MGVVNLSLDTSNGSPTRWLHRTVASAGRRRTSIPLSREYTWTTSCSHMNAWRSLTSTHLRVCRWMLIVCMREPVRTSCKKAFLELAHMSVGYASRHVRIPSGKMKSRILSSAQGRNCPRGAY